MNVFVVLECGVVDSVYVRSKDAYARKKSMEKNETLSVVVQSANLFGSDLEPNYDSEIQSLRSSFY